MPAVGSNSSKKSAKSKQVSAEGCCQSITLVLSEFVDSMNLKDKIELDVRNTQYNEMLSSMKNIVNRSKNEDWSKEKLLNELKPVIDLDCIRKIESIINRSLICKYKRKDVRSYILGSISYTVKDIYSFRCKYLTKELISQFNSRFHIHKKHSRFNVYKDVVQYKYA
ncbi:hypothetical protein D3C76_1230060 [compost metagenome]